MATNSKKLPAKYGWLDLEPGPKMFLELRKHYGVLEHPGKGSNPNIMAWAKEIGVADWYTDDDIPWCGIVPAIVTQRCGYPHHSPHQVLGARYWADDPKGKWKGYGLKIPVNQAKFMDIMVFNRPGGQHVAFYMAENDHAFLCMGGNQSNALGLAWIDKARCYDVRRPAYKIGVPPNIRKIHVSFSGELSKNES